MKQGAKPFSLEIKLISNRFGEINLVIGIDKTSQIRYNGLTAQKEQTFDCEMKEGV